MSFRKKIIYKQGDSGGPLITQSSNGSFKELIGIVSAGYKCAERFIPGIYVRVTGKSTNISLSFVRSGIGNLLELHRRGLYS